MIELNSFQKRCIEKLSSRIELLGIKVSGMTIEESDEKWFAEKEVFVEAYVNDIKIWIYDDGAHIQLKNFNKPFEAPDYDTDDDLINAFVENVITLVRKDKE